MSALFHYDNLLARSYSSSDLRPARVRPMLTPDFRPLWENSATFSADEIAEHKARAQRLNQRFSKLTKVTGNGGTKSPFKAFHNNLVPDMCYVEDVFHTKCSHWAENPRVYHRCALAAESDSQGAYCFNKKTCGSAEEDSMCQKCASLWLHKLESEQNDEPCEACGHKSKQSSKEKIGLFCDLLGEALMLFRRKALPGNWVQNQLNRGKPELRA